MEKLLTFVRIPMFLSTFGLGECYVANWASGHENTSKLWNESI